MITRIIYPFRLREIISQRVAKFFPNLNETDVSLAFNRKIKLDLSKNDHAHRFIIFNGFVELKLTKDIIKLAKKGGIFIDVGANYGYYSCLWAAQNINNKVVAFEASPVNIEPLMNNVKKNNLKELIKIEPFALGKEKGISKFEIGKESGWGGLTIINKPETIEINVCTLDDYVENNDITHIDVLKIDTEGADTWVLYGAEKLLREKKIKHIFFERNIPRMRELGIEINDAKNFLESHNYIVKEHSFWEIFYAYPK